jgi:hypothetical protein
MKLFTLQIRFSLLAIPLKTVHLYWIIFAQVSMLCSHRQMTALFLEALTTILYHFTA